MARVEDDVDSSKSERVWTVIVDVPAGVHH